MLYRIEVAARPDCPDVAGESTCTNLNNFFDFSISSVKIVTVYIIDLPITFKEAQRSKDEIFCDPVIQIASFDNLDTGTFDWCIEVGFKPGVTDSVGGTAKEAVEDLLGRKFKNSEKVFTAKQYRLRAPLLTEDRVRALGEDYLGNTLIETITIQTFTEWKSSAPNINPPVVIGSGEYHVREFDLNIDDKFLIALSRERTLSLDLREMHAIQGYFARKDIQKDRRSAGISNRITDVELEALAQTWSEHCKHKIFNSLIHYKENGSTEIIDSLFNTCIKESTRIIGKRIPWLLSVFKDNAGVIRFNDRINLVYKVETHNSPSALEPYGGALTGIVGVNRDPMGTGLGAALLYNVWGYCFGSPFYDKEMPSGLLHPNRIREGVHKGVIDGGNQTGIPYARGWEFFDERYIGKPIVYCGTVGFLPSNIEGKLSYEKKTNPGDLIVMVGGRIGKDGIHGATFSSEELHEGSPVQAVQIGDPITQKKMSDFLLEARDKGLYLCITDNGAGGLSSSVGEMAQFSNGCYLDLTKAPLKYQGLDPWEILISEAQERMTLAVSPEHKEALFFLAAKRGVEVTELGHFNDSGKFHVVYRSKTVAYLDMNFLHEGLPQMELEAEWSPPELYEPEFDEPDNLTGTLFTMLGRLNICSNEGKSRQYDHEVKGLSVIKPFVGIDMDVPSDASVFLVEHGSKEGVILAEGKNPHYSDIDTYHMAASAIDEATRRTISAGGGLGYIAGLDNFCWPDPVQSEKTPDGHHKLAQLVRANKALYDYTIAYNIPCISGKDSMKNDCILDNKKISIPPTFLFSVISKIDDVSRAVTIDIKRAGDLVYVVGETFFELGGSEYYQMMGEKIDGNPYTGKNVPQVHADKAVKIYKAIEAVTGAGLAHSIDLAKVPQPGCERDDHILFSESNSRFIITVHPEKMEKFEKLLAGIVFAEIGRTTEEPYLTVRGIRGNIIIYAPLDELKSCWKNTLKDFFHGIA
ncbi:phosphoribosylformylglycinamidine synthase [bacterium SM23_31]|nr:MAG: phosphoribosylformylglycinamidine synthase [bacterium SM23_31]